MKVVLRKDVANLGRAGEVREVADGYGRNYLIPRGLAAPATRSAIANAAAQQASTSRQRERLEAEQRALAQRIEEARLVVHAATGQGGRLYGSITSADIADALQKAIGENIDKRDIDLDAPIRQLGEQSVRVHIGPGIVAALVVTVEAEASAEEEPKRRSRSSGRGTQGAAQAVSPADTEPGQVGAPGEPVEE